MTEEQDLFRDSFRRFLDKEVVPNIDEWSQQGQVDREVFTQAGAAGFLGFAVPTEFGGGGVRDFRYNLVLNEEVQAAVVPARGSASPSTPTSASRTCWTYRRRPKEPLAPGVAAGELITAIAMTEPVAGSDLAGIGTTARRDGDDYVVNGSKTFITNGINADLVIVAVKTDPGERHRGIRFSWPNGGWRDSSAAATWTRSGCTPRTPPSCFSTTCASRS